MSANDSVDTVDGNGSRNESRNENRDENNDNAGKRLTQANGLTSIGEISAVFGVKGWLKVHSFTEPMENILAYDNWLLEKNGQQQSVNIDEARKHGNGIVVHIKDVDDRDVARQYCKSQILIPLASMPLLQEDDYYWHQLEGLQVYQQAVDGQQGVLLGTVDYLLETGANDVLVVKTVVDVTADAKQAADLLIPYLYGDVVKLVDLENGIILVDWQLDWQND